MSCFPPSPFLFHPIMMITNKSSSWFHLSKDFSQNCAGSFRCCGHGRGSETERGTEIELDIHKQTSFTTHWGHWEGHTEVRLRQTRKGMKLNKNQKVETQVTKLRDYQKWILKSQYSQRKNSKPKQTQKPGSKTQDHDSILAKSSLAFMSLRLISGLHLVVNHLYLH